MAPRNDNCFFRLPKKRLSGEGDWVPKSNFPRFLRAPANMADSEDEDSSLNLTGFLFGNINEKGELEDTEILDEVTNVQTQTTE